MMLLSDARRQRPHSTRPAPRAMIQPVAKLRFVERYCKPSDGWRVFVDIDASEEGKTGSPRQTAESQARQALARAEAPRAVADLIALGAHVRERKPAWLSCFGKSLPLPKGDRDILAVDCERRRLWIVEVEGDSGGQPEGKIYRALGQLVCAVSETTLAEYERFFTLVVHDDHAAGYLLRARAASALGISGLMIGATRDHDRWLFGEPPLPFTSALNGQTSLLGPPAPGVGES